MTAGTIEKVYRLSDDRLTPMMGAVLAYYAYRAYYMDGRCAWPSLATVASACFCDEKTVRRALTRLCELGYMQVNPDQSWNARNPETGQWVRRGYRSKVYDVLVENFETLADEGHAERAQERAECRHQGSGEKFDDDEHQTGQNVHPDEIPMISTVSQTGQNVRSENTDENKVDIVSPRTGQNVHLPTSNQQSSPAPTGHPPAIQRQTMGDGRRGRLNGAESDHDRRGAESASYGVSEPNEADEVLDALTGMRSSLGLETPMPIRRDRRAVGGLLERLRGREEAGKASAIDEILRVIAWIPANTFWLRRAITGRALVANWPDIVNDYAVDLIDRQRAYEAQVKERDKPQPGRGPHRHTWLCSHVLAELGCTSEQVQADEYLQEQAWRIASRMNAGVGKRTSMDTGADSVREEGA